MTQKALIIGNSAGIGLATTRALLGQGWTVVGLSKSESPVKADNYVHHIIEVQHPEYVEKLDEIFNSESRFDLCMYCPGIGNLLDFDDMQQDIQVFEVNLLGLVKTVTYVIPGMLKSGSGHFIGLSSVADELLSAEAPSYHATKAGFSTYLESMALAVKDRGVNITNLRFGFVDTKMAKGDVKPFMLSLDKAVQHVLTCIEKKPIRYTAPKIIIPMVRFRRFMLGLQARR